MSDTDGTSDYSTAKGKGRVTCCVPRCVHYANRPGSEGLSFFTLPSATDWRYSTWLHRIRRESSWQPGPGSRVCSTHFLPSDFQTKTKKGKPATRALLLKTAIPSQFNCLPVNSQPANCQPSHSRSTPKDRSGKISTGPPRKKRKLAACVQTEVCSADVQALRDELEQLRDAFKRLQEESQQKDLQITELKNDLRYLEAKKNTRIGELLLEVQEANASVQALTKRLTRQEFRAETFADSDKAIQNLTGLPSYLVLLTLYETVFAGKNEGFLDTLLYTKQTGEVPYPDRSRGGAPMALDGFNQYFLTLMKLRTGMTYEVLAAIFGVDARTIGRYYNCWLLVMDERMVNIFRKYPYDGIDPLPLPPKVAALFPKISMIIDGFEIKIQKPKNPDAARKCWSNYKKSYTIKYLVGSEADGNMCFLSHPYQGSISDPAIVKASNLFLKLGFGDVVLADRGFQMTELAQKLGIKWIVPPSVRKDENMSREKLKDTAEIARVRIVIENAIGRAKTFNQIRGPLYISDLQRIDTEVRVVFNLCKFLPPLRAWEESDPDMMDSEINDLVHEESAEEVRILSLNDLIKSEFPDGIPDDYDPLP
ncbi:uncharacterized protein LOC129602109 [Paramacrobiotus metropolitanus]|uniref:uncharacterized protein LOC129602109 n=1 Tax=Paramacrobiotus metropolitanus TaxID=2943436 RepID=UPI002446082A|nr:uncharacterized protein LOC129602109 [Paramacrobiotus metropolitanus]